MGRLLGFPLPRHPPLRRHAPPVPERPILPPPPPLLPLGLSGRASRRGPPGGDVCVRAGDGDKHRLGIRERGRGPPPPCIPLPSPRGVGRDWAGWRDASRSCGGERRGGSRRRRCTTMVEGAARERGLEENQIAPTNAGRPLPPHPRHPRVVCVCEREEMRGRAAGAWHPSTSPRSRPATAVATIATAACPLPPVSRAGKSRHRG